MEQPTCAQKPGFFEKPGFLRDLGALSEISSLLGFALGLKVARLFLAVSSERHLAFERVAGHLAAVFAGEFLAVALASYVEGDVAILVGCVLDRHFRVVAARDRAAELVPLELQLESHVALLV